MSTIWRLRIDGPFEPIKSADELLAQFDPCPALGWSAFKADEAGQTGYLEILFADRIDEEAVKTELALTGSEFTTHFAPLPDEDWIAMSLEGLPSVEAGRFLVYGAHTQSDLKPHHIGLEIEAGRAFGTGHHGTTSGCLIAADRLATNDFIPQSVLDLGTGSGLLAIAAAKLWPDSDILASDIDPESVEETLENAKKNSVHFACVTANGFDHSAFNARRFNLVFANILAGPLIALSYEIAQRTQPSGRIILSGLLEDQADKVKTAYLEHDLQLISDDVIDNWACLVFAKA